MCSDIWVLTSYFNSRGYESKRLNFARFLEGMHSVCAPVLVVELAFGEAPFELLNVDPCLRLRCECILWQKERLLNLALKQLPPSCTKVAWVDCDILFEDPEWLEKASLALDRFPVIQPFSEAVRLPRNHALYSGEGEVYRGFGAKLAENRQSVTAGAFDLHGHTGFAWAARRGVLEASGFYDASITGSGDHLMAHAMMGDFESECVKSMVGHSGRFRAHFVKWAERAFALVNGSVGFTPGRVLHLWHGNTEQRRYYLRNAQLQSFSFNPEEDLMIDHHGAWKWASNKPALHRWARNFFMSRNEDGMLNKSLVQLLSLE
jgi:hypothetical protein